MEVKNPVFIDLILTKFENKILANLRDIFLILSFATLTGICAKLKIEIGPVPITMQTLTVLLSGAILGSKRGAFSQIIYLFFGLLGIPLFSRGGGMTYIFSPTFGYLLGFVFCAYLVGWFFERGWGRDFRKAILAMIFGNAILYISGLLWLAKFIESDKVLTVGFYPFILGDLVKIFLAGFLLPFCLKIIKGRQNL